MFTQKQKENLAQFHSNLTLAVLSLGFLTPLFTGIGNIFTFLLKFVTVILGTVIILRFALK